MKKKPSIPGALFELGRISNLPTVISNGLVGAAIGAGVVGTIPALPVAVVILGICLLYVGGMALNDVLDAYHDAQHAPRRPIPSKRISRGAAFIFSMICIAGGLVGVAVVSLHALAPAVGLTLAIIVYNTWHRHTAAAAVVMGLCRALVYVTTAVTVAWPLDMLSLGLAAGGLLVYVTMLTIIARAEHSDSKSPARFLFLFMVFVPIIPVVVPWHPLNSEMVVLTLIFIIWTAVTARGLFVTPPVIKRTIENWIAGICLLDAMILSSWIHSELAAMAGLCFLATLMFHRVIRGT
jgi:4-hydroxybenzoate polyprenyltransferase